MSEDAADAWELEQVLMTFAGVAVTLVALVDLALDLVPAPWPFLLLLGWLLWFLKLYAQRRLPPFPLRD